MKADTVIVSNWQQEIQQARHNQQQQQQRRKAEQWHYYKEFRESICDLFDSRDFQFYSEMTGIQVRNLRRMAKYSTDPDYKRPARNLHSRRQFYIDNGHSITKPNPIFHPNS